MYKLERPGYLGMYSMGCALYEDEVFVRKEIVGTVFGGFGLETVDTQNHKASSYCISHAN